MNRLRQWLVRKWSQPSASTLRAYHATFSSLDGQIVLNHLFDNVYCTVYEGTDGNAALVHNARRSIIQEILMNIDAGEHPKKYDVTQPEQESLYAGPVAS